MTDKGCILYFTGFSLFIFFLFPERCWFSDVLGCYFAGDTLEEVWQDAKSAIEVHFAK
ncbi:MULTISPECIES: type II toxin-antitoxin system HicB family antitoxin [Photorhabdus]|uniref:type II toxin-antitoxin system HicB family antitoxin n=1 Tax=Photorhabdus TaxID=29487 RepID=UPI000AEB1996|nr:MULTISPECIES: type II toxin-antitoxin system HicB family antitoxin [Photorhabdus]AXG43572.1 hypothetical protein PluDJC_15835 [Photorhabdus laumondii subsp. laumondii]MCC8390542.1 type II toxin-antitoxin system HicB family antitoxin [Photorhabdus laumondii]MCZ1247580.1 hypothetical protein [Photorhabdus laumondii subsp. laumondii]NDL17441.1 hypothetical protein [Photorhabdus laumondii subsp. laumondii]NDL49206.1 hypothetical protein [Photorhabdus laumondii subsp. laumondii]